MPAAYQLPRLWQDFKTNTGHGKLLLDDSLYPEAYATNVNEQVYMPHLQVSKAYGDTTTTPKQAGIQRAKGGPNAFSLLLKGAPP